MESLARVWARYEQGLASAGATLAQRQEMQKAFYNGASTLLAILKTIPDDWDGERGAAVLEGLEQECVDYAKLAIAKYEGQRGKGFGQS
ncbi:hypothetical protein [Stenomitos frigidus]|uniref:Uncharacterized protein n=1 Tax=Stenomitos frigidus ULC18 TaxID=2107698 RepID=A0A2T1EB18_9CYAN|nr:hypothetical protein [Stenomitos frigidus]PSB29901.1 hypothetical protein C7B82_10130 [Stenomitos frigidus ULC18]